MPVIFQPQRILTINSEFLWYRPTLGQIKDPHGRLQKKDFAAIDRDGQVFREGIRMKITYLGYQENILARAVEGDLPRVFVFADQANLAKAREYYQPPFLKPPCAFLTLRDLKEKLFPPDRLVLREEKLPVFFYQLLTAEEKEELQIDDYFDVIEPAGHFFRFYDELSEYEIHRLTGLQEWQEKKYRILQGIRERYLAGLDKLEYTDATLAFDFSRFNGEFLGGYREIVFVNIINFTPKEKRLLRFLEEKGWPVHLYLQMSPADFDEENLRLKAVSLPEQPGTEIQLYYTEEDLLQAVNLVALAAAEKPFAILDADPDNPYHRLLATGKIGGGREVSFKETKIYRYLEALYNLALSARRQGGYLQVEVNALLQALYLPEFRAYYGLGESAVERLQEAAAEEYVYYYSPGEFSPVMEDLARLERVENLSQLCSFLEKLDLQSLNDRQYAKNITRYFDALLELNSLEEMGIAGDWEQYFSRRALGLFRLALNYLAYKKVERIQEANEEIKITPLREAPHLYREKVAFINITHGIIPSEGGGNFLLTDRQRKGLGLPTAAEKRLWEKYAFFRHLFSSKRAVVFTLKNPEENLTPSSFLEELRLKYNLKMVEAGIRAGAIPAAVAGIFAGGGGVVKPKSKRAAGQDWPAMEEKDFPGRTFSLTYYKYRTLDECYFKFYIEYIVRAEKRVQPGKKISPPLFGALVHEIFAEVLNRAGPELNASSALVEEVIDNKFYTYSPKINDYYCQYYRAVLLNKVRDSVLHFLQVLKEKTGAIQELKTEYRPVKGETPFFRSPPVDLYLSGRVDLLVDTGEKRWVIDFKTGAGSLVQLDFYALLLGMEAGRPLPVERAVYDVLKQQYSPGLAGAETDLAAKIRGKLQEFFTAGEYRAVYKQSLCQNCDWFDLCRVVKDQ